MWWSLFTVVLVAAVAFLVFYAIRSKLSVRWWEWVLATIGLLLFVFMLQNFSGAFVEGETKAAWTFLWTLGIPALILIILPFIMVAIRNSSKA